MNEIKALLASHAHQAAPPNTINTTLFNNRNASIADLTVLISQLEEATAEAKKILSEQRRLHGEEIGLINTLCGKPTYADIVAKPPPPTHAMIGDQPIACVVVQSVGQCVLPGVLYYVAPLDKFAVLIAGKLFTGNVGKIFPPNSTIDNVKNCSGLPCTRVNCTWYHPNRRGFRNYTASSWVYSPQATHHATRRFGDRTTLTVDKDILTAEEKEIFHDQTMHDILCSLVLHNAGM